jgi:tetratricopeptide (TPR) repeat protein
MNTRLGYAVLLAVLVAGAAPALADDAADAKTHYQKATAHYAVGEYREAAAEYESAYKAKQDPALLYNAAQSHRLAGDNQKALLLYKNIVKLHPSSKYAVESKDRIEKLEQAIATTQSPPNGPAPVEGSGVMPPPPPPTAAPIATTAGSPVAPGAPVQPIGQPAPGAGAPPAAVAPPSPGAPASTLTASPPPEGSTPIYEKWWFWAGAGVVVAAVAISVIALSSGGGGAWSNVPDVHGVRQ